jgi:hypothetical protein
MGGRPRTLRRLRSRLRRSPRTFPDVRRAAGKSSRAAIGGRSTGREILRRCLSQKVYLSPKPPGQPRKQGRPVSRSSGGARESRSCAVETLPGRISRPRDPPPKAPREDFEAGRPRDSGCQGGFRSRSRRLRGLPRGSRARSTDLRGHPAAPRGRHTPAAHVLNERIPRWGAPWTVSVESSLSPTPAAHLGFNCGSVIPGCRADAHPGRAPSHRSRCCTVFR